ncbi:MAG: ABC transporter permease [Terracidiphilus sp.]
MGNLFGLTRIWTRRSKYVKELDGELRFHVDELTDEFVAAGLEPAEARRRALLKLGNPQRIREQVREMSVGRYLTDLFRDLRFAVRSLRRAANISAVAVTALALGIGFSATVFSVVYNGVLRPFPYRAATRQVSIVVADPKNDLGEGRSMFSLNEIAAFRRETRDFEDITAYTTWFVRYLHDGGAEMLHGGALAPNAMEYFGMRPVLGRGFTPHDSEPNAAPVVLLNYHFWQSHFHGDPHVLGTTLELGGRTRTVIGIMPSRFALLGSDLYLPVPWQTSQLLDENEPTYYFANGILRPGVSHDAASAGLNVIVSQLKRVSPDDFPEHSQAIARDWSDALYREYIKMFYLLAAAVGLLLIISCSNAAGLLLVHASARQKEMAVRTALGAGKRRLMRQFLAESLVLAAVGCLMGCLLTWAALDVISKWLAAGVFAGEADVHLNWPTLVVAVCVSFVATVAAGIAPAIVSLRGNLQKQLGGNGVGVNTSFRGGGFRSALVVGQVALSVVLLVAAGLVMRTFMAMMHVDYGIQSTNLLSAWVEFPKSLYKSPEERIHYIEQLMSQLEAIPGVYSAAESFDMPLQGGADSDLTIVGKPHQGKWNIMIDGCSADYFKTLGLELLRGRLISQDDVAATHPVAVINEAMARKYFGTDDPIGHQIKLAALDQDHNTVHNATFSIIGVVSDFANAGIEHPPAPEAVIPHSFIPVGGFGFLVRTEIDPDLLLNSMRRVMYNKDPEVTLTEPMTIDQFLDQRTYAKPRFGVVSFAVCAGVGLLLSLIGIFTITAYTVSLMTHEIGIRMALGARPGNVLEMVLRKCLKVVGIGIGLGLAAALLLVPALRSQLWGVSAFDGVTFAAVALLLAAAGALAAFLPALRAVRIDPNRALRAE